MFEFLQRVKLMRCEDQMISASLESQFYYYIFLSSSAPEAVSGILSSAY